ncbi:uncharacterized protein LTR77_005253 [Saxophila tyrrhenica]|uniref:Uncharacterized protein n=1 Tax=Saxophila tyrrhenica TaxID=1690608 RepID=A0AAV9PFQ4_9PEZI|nr:hypothetical protein LTR77_005253 [Saxophila tyrrhenica]
MSAARSPDTASPIYPDRAIRPLPKSKLKSKLSPEQVSHISYPPEPSPDSVALYLNGQDGTNGNGAAARVTNGEVRQGRHQPHHPRTEHGHVHNHCTCGEEIDSGDEEVEFDHPDYRYAPPATNGAVAGQDKVLDGVQRRLMEAARMPIKPPPPGSTASSADGYESFENMSNKKKRKIPQLGTPSMHQSQLSAEMANMGISASTDGGADDVRGPGGAAATRQQAASVQSGTGISGAGRGRYGRQNGRPDHGVRRPLASSNMNAVNGYNSRLPPRHVSADAGIENTGGIISQAIKTAAEQGPLTPQKGQDSGSLLQSAASNSSATSGTRTQFTFTMESESGNKMVDQQSAAAAAAAMATPTPQQRVVNGQPPNPGAGGRAVPGQAPRQAPLPQNHRDPNSPSAQPPKPRRRPSKQFAMAAQRRRINQQYDNYHSRPSKDNMWICEFCEYESIFGVPPYALIRQYEIKDRKARQKEAEKRRLLDKAKARNRRGKKGSKKQNANNAAAAQHPSNNGAGGAGHHGAYDPNLPPPQPGEEEEYYDDEDGYEGDEYDPIGGGGDGGGRGDGGEEIEYDDDAYFAANPPAPAPPPAVSAAGVGSGGGGAGGGGGGRQQRSSG